MRPLLILLAVMLLVLQWRLWNRDGGVPEVRHLQQKIESQESHNNNLARENDVLVEKIERLKTDKDAIEFHAREDLGLIHKNETWVTVGE